MGKRTWFSIIVGIVILAIGMILRKVADAEGPQILLSLLAFILVGLIAAGVRRGFMAGLVLGAAFGLVNGLVNRQFSFESASVAAASIVVGVVLPSLLAGGISALFGLIGRFLFKRG
ncbi:MAG: hypothetical protein HYX90_00110 [Chloroflexi bacterium]|nr:hypothetical protein [Chloroflexota bacterium]